MFNMEKAKSILTAVSASLIITTTVYATSNEVEVSEPKQTPVIETVTEIENRLDGILIDTLESPLLQPVDFQYGIVYLEIIEDGTSNEFYHLWSEERSGYTTGEVVKAKATLSNGWYQLLNGEYISSDFVKVRSDLGNKLFVRVTVDALNVRPTPDVTGEPVGGVYKGDLLEATAVTDEGWYELSEENYINSKYAEMLDVTPAEFNQLKAEREAAIKAEKERIAKLKAEQEAARKAKAQAAQKSTTQQTQQPVSYQPASSGSGSYASIQLSSADRELLARLIYCEANVEPFEGQVGVAQVIFNRVLDSRFPNTISGVVYAKNQFVPVTNGKINRITPTEENYRAIDVALSSGNLNGAVYFHDPRYSGGSWWSSLTHVASIGHHAFKK